ncbi:MAG: UDP-N-acetylmuramate--L-alanine ligase [Candidatus Doudnabacteria bacterium]|nr:UDP-N-acetylmuramate--L-alanine ligase [Candidatus Doudnabacteria bacterium]
MDLTNVRKIYFIGIGGIAMSATAGLAQERGFEVFGSDAATIYPPAKNILEDRGITVFYGYAESQIATADSDLYVVSAGEAEENPEVAWLVREEIEFVSFPELLYELSKDTLRIVVSGTHGKSSTSGWLGHVLKCIDDSSFMVGAVLRQYESNFYSGTGHYIVFEGDEYKSTYADPTPKMHYYHGDVLVLTNLEFDHPDVFQDLDEIKNEFRQLVAHVPDDGLILYNADNADLADVVYHETGRSFTFGLHTEAHMQAVNILYGDGGARFTVINRLDPVNVREEVYSIGLPGEINVYNALAVITTLRVLGFQPEVVQKYVESYEGVKRRFEIIQDGDVAVVDDYAHHATAVRETIAAARTRFPGRRLWVVFEPHTYSRTKVTLPELAESFDLADQVLLAHMYGAREHKNITGITDEMVLDSIKQHQSHVRLVHDKTEAREILEQELRSGDVVVVMAVGSFSRLAYELKERIESRE